MVTPPWFIDDRDPFNCYAMDCEGYFDDEHPKLVRALLDGFATGEYDAFEFKSQVDESDEVVVNGVTLSGKDIQTILNLL